MSRQVEAKSWATATARDWKGCGNAITRKDGKHRIDNLEAVIKYGHPDQANPNTSGKSQESWLTPRVLEVDEDYENYQKRMQESGNPKNVGKKKPANLTMQTKNQESLSLIHISEPTRPY